MTVPTPNVVPFRRADGFRAANAVLAQDGMSEAKTTGRQGHRPQYVIIDEMISKNDQTFTPKPKARPRAERSAPVRNPSFREHEGLKALQRQLNTFNHGSHVRIGFIGHFQRAVQAVDNRCVVQTMLQLAHHLLPRLQQISVALQFILCLQTPFDLSKNSSFECTSHRGNRLLFGRVPAHDDLDRVAPRVLQKSHLGV